MNEYELKFKDGGVWLDTQSFVALVKELQDRFGIDAAVTPSSGGVTFTIHESSNQ